jgi:RIO-like serine/threonine protein kinase
MLIQNTETILTTFQDFNSEYVRIDDLRERSRLNEQGFNAALETLLGLKWLVRTADNLVTLTPWGIARA